MPEAKQRYRPRSKDCRAEQKKESRKNLFERYRGQHKTYWYSRRLRETKLEDWFREEDLEQMSWEYYRYLEPGE